MRKQNLMFVVLIGVVTWFSQITFAKKPTPEIPKKLESLFIQLAASPVSYVVDGVICEQIAKIEFEKKYDPRNYYFDTGVEYLVDSRIVGELDLVISEKGTGKVVEVSEVKCWKSLDEGIDKAKMQRDRFLWTLKSSTEKIQFVALNSTQKYHLANFYPIDFKYSFTSQKGGAKWGFDFEIPYMMFEIEALRENLVHCQKKSNCPQ